MMQLTNCLHCPAYAVPFPAARHALTPGCPTYDKAMSAIRALSKPNDASAGRAGAHVIKDANKAVTAVSTPNRRTERADLIAEPPFMWT